MHRFWKLVDGFTPDQQILFLILLKPMAWLSLAIIAIGASLYAIWQLL
ncbi:hypothetical protein [Mesorhizobium sp. DCY119]|nr:hypothetical protein [Mesorhizobium sp. DCY119]